MYFHINGRVIKLKSFSFCCPKLFSTTNIKSFSPTLMSFPLCLLTGERGKQDVALNRKRYFKNSYFVICLSFKVYLINS